MFISSLLFLLIVMLHCESPAAVYVVIREERSCFTTEQPRDTPMIFNYEILSDSEDRIDVGFTLYYGLLTEPNQMLLNKVLADKIGHVDFTADNDGVFTFCMQLPLPAPPVRFHWTLNYGFDADYYENLVKKYNYDAVNLQVHKLNDMITLTLNEADYQKHREVDFHQETEAMNNTALWWPIVQIAILIITGIYQVQHLKNFFKLNKLI